ncbi:GNAT family N-acetyltransferase [Streptomyces sp. NPDC093509]|uniref:GNAT family N-acetyltransferase n=1 Tax=Streptomyces sp. NPDC093509 TaxID=3154982 RepID=UPI00344C2B74
MAQFHDPLRQIVSSFTTLCQTLATATNGQFKRELDGTVLAVSGSSIATLNGLISPNLEPSPETIESLASDPSLSGVPWSIQLRGVPGQRVCDIASRFGLTMKSTTPLMVRRPDIKPPAESNTGLRVSPVEGDRLGLYVETLAEGFGVPAEAFKIFTEPSLAAKEGLTFYSAEVDGIAVGTGMAAISGDLLGVYNISVVPEHRQQGHGRTITTEIIRAGYEVGATTAYLYSSDMGEPLYTSIGFRTEEIKTVFTKPE